MAEATSNHWPRDRSGEDAAEVTTVELFFDLVFALAITQLSHALFASLTPEGATRTLLVFLAVWWVWVYTTWVTNRLDPNRLPVRALMFAGLVLSVSLPDAFGDRGLSFALAYAAMQVGRSFFMLWARTRASHDWRATFQRVTACAAAPPGLVAGMITATKSVPAAILGAAIPGAGRAPGKALRRGIGVAGASPVR